jgi:hypothetical protein
LKTFAIFFGNIFQGEFDGSIINIKYQYGMFGVNFKEYGRVFLNAFWAKFTEGDKPFYVCVFIEGYGKTTGFIVMRNSTHYNVIDFGSFVMVEIHCVAEKGK